MISSVDFYLQHSSSSSHFIKYQLSLNQNFSLLLGSIFFAVDSDQEGQVRVTSLCTMRSEPLWAYLQVEFQFSGPLELLICPSRREYWHRGKDRPCILLMPSVSPLALIKPSWVPLLAQSSRAHIISVPEHCFGCGHPLLWDLQCSFMPPTWNLNYPLKLGKNLKDCSYPRYVMFSSSHPSFHVLFTKSAFGIYICLQRLP